MKNQSLGFSETAIKILEKEIDVHSSKVFRDYGMPGGPTVKLADFAKECKEKKKRAFSSYRSLEEVLLKYGITSNNITSIPQFVPGNAQLTYTSLESKLCIDDILRRIKSMEPIVIVTSSEDWETNSAWQGVTQNLIQCKRSCDISVPGKTETKFLVKLPKPGETSYGTDYLGCLIVLICLRNGFGLLENWNEEQFLMTPLGLWRGIESSYVLKWNDLERSKFFGLLKWILRHVSSALTLD
ncbi:hypothetical protein C1646_772086 [Rhizophagus diaphanus]|nr:hypothetical protein C1646_772086 [Rhizophagus diaphanus] [Rhizophagus sp. MUCL 43196]